MGKIKREVFFDGKEITKKLNDWVGKGRKLNNYFIKITTEKVYGMHEMYYDEELDEED